MSSTSKALAAELTELYARVPRGMRLGLEAMNAAVTKLGHPERTFPAVHIAGTNGKGSTAAMVEAMARAHGLSTGRYTSPHLARFAERIALNGEPITDARLTEVLNEANTQAPDLSFFETATLAAFLAFRLEKVDIAIIEVGIGGRLDATNILPPPRVTAITRIALDHVDRLGATEVEIAREKAGIAKHGSPLVVGPITGPPLHAIERIAESVGAPIRHALPDPREVLTSLAGDHQRENARVAIAMAKELAFSDLAIKTGLAQARWPGRLETLDLPEGRVLLDGAHNLDGVRALVRHLRSAFSNVPCALVFGTLADKDGDAMLDDLAAHFSSRAYVAPKGRAAMDPARYATRHLGIACNSIGDALSRARESVGKDGLVVVAGSIYLVGEARSRLLELPVDPPVAL